MMKRLTFFSGLFLLSLLALVPDALPQDQDTLRVHFIDVGQGDSILIQTISLCLGKCFGR